MDLPQVADQGSGALEDPFFGREEISRARTRTSSRVAP